MTSNWPDSEPASLDQDSGAEPGAEGIDDFPERALDFVSEQALDFVREEAARRDPRHTHIYATVSAGRVKDAADTAQQLLAAHLEQRRRQGRGARTGRRTHLQTVYAILDASNEANLVLADAFLELALAVLPASHSREGD